MENNVNWLPDLVLFEDYANNWEKYLEAVYSFYKQDFLDSRPIYRGTPVGVKKLPVLDGKEAGFWHLIQEGAIEDDRVPDFRRCERVRWPKPIIEHALEKSILIWPNKRHTKAGIQKSVCLWLEQHEYLVVLRERRNGYLFWTAYPVTQEHRKRKLMQEYQESKKTGDAISDDPDTLSTHGR